MGTGPAITGGATRMGVFYALTFASTGASLPYIAAWMHGRGLSGAEIGLVLGAPMLGRIAGSPLLAVWADSFRLRRTAIAVLALVSAAALCALVFATGLGAIALLWFIAASASGSMAPLTDVLNVRAAQREGFDFAAVRGMGSLSFIAVAMGMGAVLSRLSVEVVAWWIAGVAVAATAAAAIFLPPEPVSEHGPLSRADRIEGLRALVADRTFMLAIVSTGLIQAAHAFYYGFGTLAWTAQGLPKDVIGLLWSFGVAVEIVFLWFLGPWRRRVGPWRVLMLGGGAAALRWTVMAFSPPLWLLWPLQALHALSFAASFTATLQIVERLSPPRFFSAGQTLSSALSAGALIGVATLVSGALFDQVGAWGYLAMSAMAVAGLAGAWRLKGTLEDV